MSTTADDVKHSPRVECVIFGEQDCLAAFTEAETITDFTCDGCGQRRATKRLLLAACPPVLMLSLKRFARDAPAWHSKNTARVAIPADGLDVGPYCSSTAGSCGGGAPPPPPLPPLSRAASAAHKRLAATAQAAALAAGRGAVGQLGSEPTRIPCGAGGGRGGQTSTRYNLAAVACHTGSLAGGHCTALTRHPGDCNDNQGETADDRAIP